ncbi:ATPase [candidate division KSB1 bacterium]|nr:MAG: ATPase [candidate division KSB1 bacterium]
MKIALPLAEKKVSMHFGHCEEFAIIEIDEKTGVVLKKEFIKSPPHQPGLLPQWLADKGAEVVITGGMGRRAIGLFKSYGIDVVVGCPVETPDRVALDYVKGNLITGESTCDH